MENKEIIKELLENVLERLPKKKELTNRILTVLAKRNPRKRFCSHIEEKLCDACDEKLEIVKLTLSEVQKIIKDLIIKI